MIRKFAKKLNALILALCIIALQFAIGVSAEITYPMYAKIRSANNNNYAKVMSQAGQNSNPNSVFIENIYNNEIVMLLESKNDPDGDMWYKILYGTNFSKEGYVYSAHVVLMGNYIEDPAFEESIKDFPESYKVKLRQLHSLYPKWEFVPDWVGRSFDEVVAAESVPGKKLVSYTAPDSWKSNDPETKNPDGSWKWYDSGGWVAASKMVIEYYMDPRNMLDKDTVFMFARQNYDANYDTADKLQKILNGTFMSGALQDDATKTYLNVIMGAGATHGVSPLVMAAKFIQEQGAQGTGGNITGNVVGFENLYNFFNVGAYADADRGFNAVQRGLWWANGAGSGATTYGRPWTSREKSIYGGAEWFAEQYLGGYQNTFYYMNFDVKGNYSHQYATNIQDGAQKAKGLAKGFADVPDLEMVFNIPIYDNMPDYTALPSENSNNNNYLKVFEVEGYSLGYNQNYQQPEYELMVEYNRSSINIIAIPDYSEAVVSGAGVRQLAVGHNEIKISVRATSGEVRVYTLHVYRDANSGGVVVPAPTLNTSYKIGDYLTGVNFETDVNTFIANLGVSNGTARVFDTSNNEKSTGIIATGDVVKIYDTANAPKGSYTIMILGDASGDGRITARDMLMGQRHILKISLLSDAYLAAADIDKDGTVKARDMLMGQRHILKISQIIQ